MKRIVQGTDDGELHVYYRLATTFVRVIHGSGLFTDSQSNIINNLSMLLALVEAFSDSLQSAVAPSQLPRR
jgi:hypothetical protein